MCLSIVLQAIQVENQQPAQAAAAVPHILGVGGNGAVVGGGGGGQGLGAVVGQEVPETSVLNFALSVGIMLLMHSSFFFLGRAFSNRK